MTPHGGWYWPDADTDARAVITRDCLPSIAALLPHVEGRDCIVQAGANVGLYPVALTDHFQRVVTFEPDPENWACLKRNLAARDSLGRVTAHNLALGAATGSCRMEAVSVSNCGAHRIKPGSGSILIQSIDSFDLPACDAIWLDVEGSELAALKGAVQTIEKFSPTIAIEDKGLDGAFGVARGEAISWLGFFGYDWVDRIGQDKIFRRRRP